MKKTLLPLLLGASLLTTMPAMAEKTTHESASQNGQEMRMKNKDKSEHTKNHKARMQELINALDLTPDQQEKLKAFQKEKREQYSEKHGNVDKSKVSNQRLAKFKEKCGIELDGKPSESQRDEIKECMQKHKEKMQEKRSERGEHKNLAHWLLFN